MTAFSEACRAVAAETHGAHQKPRGPRAMTLTNPYGLTSREIEVVRLLVEGDTNAEMGAKIFVKEHTIKFHLGHIMEKMGCRNRVQVAVKWVREQEAG